MFKSYLMVFILFSFTAYGNVFKEGYNCAIEGNFECALAVWEPLAKNGDASSQYSLGVMFQNGNGVKTSHAKAIFWYKKAAAQGVLNAQFNLGNYYYLGRYVEKNYIEARYWFLKAAEQGDAEAELKLGLIYVGGLGVQKDNLKAIEWYKRSAEKGNASAIYNIGAMYENGDGVSQNIDLAKVHYIQACESNIKPACDALKDLALSK